MFNEKQTKIEGDFLWYTKEELLEKTEELLQSKTKEHTMAKSAVERSKIFNSQSFCAHFDELLNSLI